MNGPDRSARRRWTLAVLAAAIGVTALLTPAQTASAHRNDESYLYLDVGDTTLEGNVQLPYADVRTVLELRLAGSDDDLRAEIESELTIIQDYVHDRTSIGADGATWSIEFEGYRLLFDRDVVAEDGGGYLILPFSVALTSEEVPQVLEVGFTPMLDEIPDRNNVVLVANDWKRGVIDEEANELLVITADDRAGTIDLGDTSHWKTFRSSIDLGVNHIRTGPDHIFFVLVLLLPSVLVLSLGIWRPAPSGRGSLIRVIIVATMFTIAHSLTFTLAGLDILPLPPSKLVESLIAASIAAAALHNVWPIMGHREWAIAFVFGLFHGMGFAGLVDDLDVSRTTQLMSLLGRNVGIEIGQLVIILITFPGLFLLRRTRLFKPSFIAASVGLALLSSLWIIERVGEVDFGFNRTIDRVLKWPRSFYLALAFTAVAMIVQQVEARRNGLLPVGGPDEEDESVEQQAEKPVPV